MFMFFIVAISSIRLKETYPAPPHSFLLRDDKKNCVPKLVELVCRQKVILIFLQFLLSAFLSLMMLRSS